MKQSQTKWCGHEKQEWAGNRFYPGVVCENNHLTAASSICMLSPQLESSLTVLEKNLLEVGWSWGPALKFLLKPT